MLPCFKRANIILLLIFLISCTNSPDRDNPLDPKSNKYEDFGNLQGHVYSYYAPYKPIISATVTIHPGNQTTYTDENGVFNFSNIDPGDYIIKTTMLEYAPDSAQVTITSQKTTNIQFNLDALPQLTNLGLFTGVYNSWFPFPQQRVVRCVAEISDPDGREDINMVCIEIPDFSFIDTLTITGFNTDFSTYEKYITENDLPINKIDELQGYPVYIKITDKAGQTCQFGPNYIIRVIDEEIALEYPKEIITESQPVFRWKQLSLSYPFTYKLELYQEIVNGIYDLIYSISNIHHEKISQQVDFPLSPGSYYWTITIMDEFGNWSLSKKLAFDQITTSGE